MSHIKKAALVFGTTADDSIGDDYDGDGLSDLGYWRGSPAPAKFEVRISSGGFASVVEIP